MLLDCKVKLAAEQLVLSHSCHCFVIIFHPMEGHGLNSEIVVAFLIIPSMPSDLIRTQNKLGDRVGIPHYTMSAQ